MYELCPPVGNIGRDVCLLAAAAPIIPDCRKRKRRPRQGRGHKGRGSATCVAGNNLILVGCTRAEIADQHDMLLGQDGVAHLLRQAAHSIVHDALGRDVRPPGDARRASGRRLDIGTAYDFHTACSCGLCIAVGGEGRNVPGRVDRSDLVGVGSGRRETIVRIVSPQR